MMTKEEWIAECLTMTGSFVDYPFDAATAVIKTEKGKMFAFLDYVNPEKMKKSCGADAPIQEGDIFINVKCDPSLIEAFRTRYQAVLPGYYSNKQHWNTVVIAGYDVPDTELCGMIAHSYDLVNGKKRG